MTKVNFKVLDNYTIKPVGVYGSKEEIVRFLSQLGAIDGNMYVMTPEPVIFHEPNTLFDSAAQLLADSDSHVRTKPALRPGLYVVTPQEQMGDSHQVFVLYWPEQTTWDDSAAPSVRRNRITFMRLVHINSLNLSDSKTTPQRYLTKMCDQIVSLISSEHAQTILWSEGDDESENDENMPDIDQDESDRMFTFEVAQTNEQEESVTVREGFKVNLFCPLTSSRLTELIYGTGNFTGNYTSRGARCRARPDEPGADHTGFTLW